MANDPYWNSVVLAMHMDNTGLTDEKGHTVTLTGGAARSSTQSKFGGYSGYFNGTTSYISLPDSADWSFGTGDWTIDAWIYTASATQQTIVNHRYSTDNNNYWVLRIAADGKANFSVKTGGVVVTELMSVAAITYSAWNHVAVVRSSGTVKIYVNGSNNDTVTANLTSAYPDVSTTLTVGMSGPGNFTQWMNGYIDDLHITKGLARYTADFSVPTAAFPDTMVQVAGTVKDASDAFAARTVRAYRRSDGALAGSATSNSTTGAFSISALDNTAHYAVCLDDGTPDENALIFDNITPV